CCRCSRKRIGLSIKLNADENAFAAVALRAKRWWRCDTDWHIGCTGLEQMAELSMSRMEAVALEAETARSTIGSTVCMRPTTAFAKRFAESETGSGG
ncbi:hypothetical protein KBX39_32580, partial [Micromonospora sp. D75]|nr:hypothetical protein [Micromonospora sp. D75]